MELLMFIFVAVIPVISDGLVVKGPSAPLVAPLGSSVVLPCYVDELLSVEGLEVEWRRPDSETLVHLYQDGESQTEAQQQDYQDRAHFFTEEIQHGNFSLRLDDLRAEDEGQYTCTVHSQQDSGENVVEIKDVVRLLVSGSSRSISASVGEDVTLNCSVDSHITPEHIEIAWKKTDENIQVLLYQNNEALPDSAHVRYRDRVEFFTAEIPKGNFSLRLKSVRTEDKGVYMCHVFAGGLSANTTVELERLGFSVLHIMVLILCVSASGSALLLCCLIYCRYQNGFTVTYSQNRDVLAGLRESVVLKFYRVKPLQTEDLKVEWRRKDSKTLVHLYPDGESRSEKQQQEYQNRAHFFTDQIQHGNFSLRLDNVEEEDAGEYICRVYSKQKCVFSTQITLEKDDFSSYLSAKVSSAPLVAPLGSSVVLPCFCAKRLLSNDLKVEWRRKETLVHLYQDGESQTEAQQQDYQDRAHLLTEEIQHGNFSLRLDDLRAEDEGQYTCIVYNKQRSVFSTQTSLELRLLDSVLHLHLFLVVCPNIIMFFAFVFWGVSEGSVSESVCCCALYFLRPLLLLWAAPFIKNRFSDKIKTWIQKYSYVAEYAVFSVVVYSALFASAWERFLNYAVFNKVVIIVLFAIVFVCCLCKIIYILVTEVGKKSGRIVKIFDVVADMTFQILPTLQFILLFYTFGAASEAGLIMIVILPVLLMMMTNDRWIYKCYSSQGLNCKYLLNRDLISVELHQCLCDINHQCL
ncbi:polymeric immunoglobulin receptor-like [Sinocyclocheilus anshuiensis]|uniref:polymeric immunoglobulin receptor-like n=1 Tax=Sinocyclocheilus anshuiensis TaxID=1608454 RepID=UPI0007B80522|nr:PREDICTED: polymeric immunoglobulin receptor-like [Sinocyclocheilus anshuiensis]